MKRFLAIICSLFLIAALSAPAFAAEKQSGEISAAFADFDPADLETMFAGMDLSSITGALGGMDLSSITGMFEGFILPSYYSLLKAQRRAHS